MTILEKIAENAEKTPERVAYYTEDVTDDGIIPCQLTWKELNEYSSRLAHYLDRTLETKKPVIVYGHKNPYMIVCFLSAVKSGRAYCPIDASVPLNRVEAICNEVDPEIVFSTECGGMKHKNIQELPSIISILENEKEMIETEKFVKAEDVFYIIFTSGSTGNPKGVMITRNCLDNFLIWAQTLLNDPAGERNLTFLNQAPFSFDLSVMDLYLSLYSGGTLWALQKKVQNNMKLLLDSFKRSGANVWVSTPSFAEMCLADRALDEQLMPGLRTFLFCGETLSNKVAERLQNKFPGAEIYNTYGPTESTVAVTQILVDASVNQKWNPLPVGQAKEGTWILIMDQDGNLLPEGEKGEIVIVGNTVSAGYWNNSELTNKVFGRYRIGKKEYRLYHTGDKGYLNGDLLFYCGRIDLQVKLHGYRIEVEDIESNMRKLPDVIQAVVMPLYRGGEVKSLTAYVVLKREVSDDFEASQGLKKELKEYLPEYMIPKKIVFLDKIPMTNNGKADRRALEAMIQ